MMNVQNWMLYHFLVLMALTRLSQAFTFPSGDGRRLIPRKTPSPRQQPLDATLSNEEQSVPPSTERQGEKKTVIDLFVSQLEASLMAIDDDSSSSSFDSFTFHGPSKKQTATFLQDGDNMVRGCIRRVDGRRIVLLKKKQEKEQVMMIQVTFKYILATDIVKNWSGVENVASNVRSLLQLGHTDTRQESSEWDTLKVQQQERSHLAIQRAVLETTDATIEVVDLNNSKKKPRLLITKKSINKEKNNAATAAEAHDRIKKVPLPLKLNLPSSSSSSESSSTSATTAVTRIDFWQALGLTTAQGQPKPSGASKIRQAQKFVEIVSGLVDTALVVATAQGKNNDPTSSTSNSNVKVKTTTGISVVDMGCGRGYLTFGLHSFLTQKYAAAAAATAAATADMENTSMLVKSRGIDVRPKLVHEISGIAKSLGRDFEHLSFAQGTIQDFLQNNNSIFQWPANEEQHQQGQFLKVLIALHACDTATDDAIWAGIVGQADVIVVAPCCHQQLRSQIDRHYYSSSSQQQSSSSSPHFAAASSLMADVLRHNIYRERMTETVTDAMRALLLEWAGYTPVKVFEFVGGEHTSKNVMITAMKGRQRRPRQSATVAARHTDELQQRLQTLGAFYGVQEHKLAEWMGISPAQQHEQKSTINGDTNDASPPPSPPQRKRQLSARNMPPL
jgi:Methyltransferase domain